MARSTTSNASALTAADPHATRAEVAPPAAVHRVRLLVLSIAYALSVPAATALYLPAFLSRHAPAVHGARQGFAWALFALALIGYGWCAVAFANRGHGIPSPSPGPAVLVVRGPYRFVRNPIYVAMLIALLGWIVRNPTPVMLIDAVASALAMHAMVVLVEEPRLARRFGAAALDYRATVPRWIPSFRR